MRGIKIFLYLIFSSSISFCQNIDKTPDEHICQFSKILEKENPSLASEKLNYYDVRHYFLDLEVTDTSTHISGNVIVKCEFVTNQPDTFVIELSSKLTVDSLYINGIKHNFIHENDLISVKLINNYSDGEVISAKIIYHGLAGTDENRGIFNRENGQTNFWITYTLSEPFGAKSWFPVKQDLGDKADSVKVHLTVPKNLKAGSNGLLTRITDVNNGKLRYEWNSKYPIAYYLISLAVADYQEYNVWAKPEGVDDSLLIQNYIYNIPGLLEAYQSDIDETVDMIHLFSDLYSLYPFHEEKYGHAMAPLGGGMEHQTMSTMHSFQFFLVAHELAHQWFGNNVTCATWQDIWINEGFASYSEYIAIQNLLGQANADSWMKSAFDRVTSQPGGSVYVPFEEAENAGRIFSSRLSYKKGAAIIHMLRFEINNDDLFYEAIKEFQLRYKDSVATGEDFKNVVEDVTGSDYDYFFDQWYYGEGFPVYTINWSQSGDSLYIYSDQGSSTDYPQLFQSSLEFEIEYVDSSVEVVRVFQGEKEETFRIPITKQVNQIDFDPNLWLLKRISGDSYFRRRPVAEDLSIAPNPAQNNINLIFSPSFGDCSIYIFSTGGKLMYSSQMIHSSNYEIPTSGWSEGIYIIKAENEEKILSKKLVIAR